LVSSDKHVGVITNILVARNIFCGYGYIYHHFGDDTQQQENPMANATVRAAARTLPEATNADRRAVLCSILAVGAIGAIPVAAEAATADSGPAGLDAELFALIDEARDLGVRSGLAYEDVLEAQRRTEDVPPPQALIATEDDARLWDRGSANSASLYGKAISIW
jgi:hypothetical protein